MAKTRRVKNWKPPKVRSVKDPINVEQPASNVSRATRRAAGARPQGWLGKYLGQNRRILRRDHRR